MLSKHAEPKLIIDENVIETDANGNIVISNLDVIIKPQGGDKDVLGYVTWDGKLDAVDRQKKALQRSMLSSTGTSPLLLATDGQDRAETGAAVVSKLLPTLFRVEGIQRELEKPLKDLIRRTMKLVAATSNRSLSISPVKIEDWGVKLPMDLQTIVQTEALQVQAGIKTPEEAKESIERKKES